MGDSNSTWGLLVAVDDELGEVWDGYAPLPQPGDNQALDALIERKRLSHAALVRVGARLAQPTVLAFGGPGWLKFRDLITDRRWSYHGSDWSRLRIIRAGAEPTATVLICEGETDCARLSDAYDCDIAMLPAGAGYFPATYAEQLAGYQQILVGLDNDPAGQAGAAKIIEALPQAQVFAPPANDWCEAENLPRLPTPRAIINVGGIIFEDLASLLSDEIPDPTVLVDDLIYTEGVHWISGHPGAGKTTLAMYVAILVMFEDRHVVWLDYEGGTRPTVRRLLASGCPTELALTHFHYAGWPASATNLMGEIADKWPNALIVLDSASKALQTAGLDENSPGEVTGWAAPMVKACKQKGFPAIVIDHMTKNATRDTRYSRGAGSKLADADVAWFIDTVTPFNREQVGVVCAHQQKDREGFLPFANWYQIGDGKGLLTVLPIDEPVEEAADAGPSDTPPI